MTRDIMHTVIGPSEKQKAEQATRAARGMSERVLRDFERFLCGSCGLFQFTDWPHRENGCPPEARAITLAERDAAIESVMRRYHPVEPGHVADDDACPECEDIVGMFLTVERYAVQQWRAGK